MKTISVDGGALYGKSFTHFGNYTFSEQLIRALIKYDQTNHYKVYLQEKYNDLPAQNQKVIVPRLGWLKLGISAQELINPSEIFLGLNQALPWYCPGKKITVCHGLAPLKYGQFYPDSQKKMQQQISNIVEKSDWIIVGSTKLRDSLNDIIRVEKKIIIKPKIKVINYGIPELFLKPKKSVRKNYLLYVGSSHPIKNLNFIFNAFTEFKKLTKVNDYQLVLVGVGKNLNIPDQIKNKVITIPHAKGELLKKLYAQARCLVSASFEESFNLPILEALSQNTPVVATKNAVIPELISFVHVSQSSISAFAKTLKQALDNPKPINRLELIEQFNWQNFVKQLIRLYE